MQTEKELLDLFEKENINLYKLGDRMTTEDLIILEDVKELIRFSNDNNLNNMFYYHCYLDKYNFLINENIIKKFSIGEEILLIIQKDLDEYNQMVSKLNFDEPISLSIYCMYQGMILSIKQYNNFYIEKNIYTAEEACEIIIEKHLEEINNHKKEKLDNIQEKRKELSEKILNDKEFQKCTNTSLRKSYGDRVIRNNADNKQLFLNRGIWYDIPINDFIEIIWREYKEISKPPIITEFSYKK